MFRGNQKRAIALIALLWLRLSDQSAFAALSQSAVSTTPPNSNNSPPSSTVGTGLSIIDPRIARDKLAEKLKKLDAQKNMKEGNYSSTEATPNSPQLVNAGDKNPYDSESTYHSYVWSYCLKWAGPKHCAKWLDPFISPHGLEGDKSPLESTVATAWQGMKKEGDTGAGGTYGIWKVEASQPGRAIIDEGKLDLAAVKRMEIVQPVKENVERVGYQTAERTISSTYDQDSGKEPDTLPNPEVLREAGERFTKMFYNRSLANVGNGRAAQKGVEFALGEDIPNCENYLTALRNNPPDDDPTEERIKPQGNLDPQTIAAGLEERYKQCQQLRALSAYKPSTGDERLDVWRSRAQMAVIAQGGIDPNSIPKPQGVELTKEETTQQVANWEVGGKRMNVAVETNQETLKSYNNQLAESAKAMKEAAALAPNYIPDASEQILANQVGDRVNLVKFNGLTREMQDHLKDTNLPRVGKNRGNERDPALALETAPSQLSVRSLQ